MSWKPIAFIERNIYKPKVACSMRVAESSLSKRKRMMYLTIRPNLIDTQFLSWWQFGTKVNALLGSGNNEGKLRVECAKIGQHVLVKANNKSSLCSLTLPVFEWVDEKKHVSEITNFDYNDQWIEIDLPAWASNAPTWTDNQNVRLPQAPKIFPKTCPLTHETLPEKAKSKVAKGFAMEAMTIPDPMIAAYEANVRRSK